MKILTISYGRKFNIGNYQTEDVHVTAELEGETLEVALGKLKTDILDAYEKSKVRKDDK